MNSKRIVALAAAAALCIGSAGALADTISFEGKVTSAETRQVYADIGGTVDTVDVKAGELVRAGAPVVTLKTTPVYAEESGVVTGIFAEPGDSVQTVAARYGAVLYIEPDSAYTISASTDNAYNSTATKYVHVGETVYLSCYSDGDHTGVGRITSVNGTDYTVEVTEGEFLVGETVSVFRTDSYKSSSRIGRGELTRSNPTAVSGSGSIVSIAVSDGDYVNRGDLLFETVEGSFDGLYMSGCSITAPVDGYIASISASQGGQVMESASVAAIYPAGAMRIEAEVSESDLGSIAVGDAVSIELNWNQDDDVTYPGTVTMISAIATSAGDGSEATYTVYIDFTPDADTRYGMNAQITTLDDEDITEADDDAQQG